MAKVCFVPAQGTLAAYLTGEIDHHAAQALRREIDAQIDARMPELLTMDFSGVTFMDSSGIGLVMGRFRLMQETGGKVILQNLPAPLRKVMKLAGLDKLAEIRGWSADEADRRTTEAFFGLFDRIPRPE